MLLAVLVRCLSARIMRPFNSPRGDFKFILYFATYGVATIPRGDRVFLLFMVISGERLQNLKGFGVVLHEFQQETYYIYMGDESAQVS